MCGIAGTSGFGDEQLLRAMTDTIAHRGPDGEGFYSDESVHLGSRRLAIQDVPGGSQPMANEDGSVVVVYNGEIYNYPELREMVLGRGHQLTTHCDTEILPHLYEDEGIAFAARLNGIFAFALFDRARGALFLVRDPLGVKPLVYSVTGRHAGLRVRGQGRARERARRARARRGEPAPVDERPLRPRGPDVLRRHQAPAARAMCWSSPKGRPGCSRTRPIDWTPDESRSKADWLEGIRFHYQEAVKRQLISDVPVGVSLSGGIDSSSIVAMLRRTTSGPIKTFSLGFDEPTDETDDARFVARTFGTEHQEVVLHSRPSRYLADAIWHTEEPKVNSLQLYLLHRFIGEHVSVVLSGLGGDELFAGYDFYGYLLRTGRLRRGAPAARPRAPWRQPWTGRRDGPPGWAGPELDLATRKLEWLAASGDGARNYLLLRNAWDFNPALLRRVYTPDFAERLTASARDGYDGYFDDERPLESQALRAEFATKMVCDLLHNEDTMSMAHSVESRVPLLDLELVRFAARIPDDIRFGQRPQGVAQGSRWPGCFPTACCTSGNGDSPSIPSSSTGRISGPWCGRRCHRIGSGNPASSGQSSSRPCSRHEPRQRLRWHYFLLWQMIGVETWLATFTRAIPGGSAARPCRPAPAHPPPEGA